MGYAGGVFSTADPNERKFRKYSDKVLLKRLIAYLLAYKRSDAIVFGSLLFAALVGVVGPLLLGFYGINALIAGNYREVAYIVLAYTGLYLANYFSDYMRTKHMQLVGQDVMMDLRRDAFARLQVLSPSYYSKREAGRIMSYIMNDVDALSDFVTFQLPQVLAGFIVIISIVLTMFVFNFDLTLVSLAVIPPLVVLTLAFQGRIQESFVETRKKIAVVTSKLQEGISGVRVTQALVKEEGVSENFDAVNTENLQANLRANKLTSLFNVLVQIVEAGGIALVLWYGASEILAGKVLIGTLVTFLLYVNSFFTPIIQLTTVYNSYQSAVTGLDRVLQVLDTEVEVPEVSGRAAGAISAVPRGGASIEFDDVTFGYDPDQPVLRHVNLNIPRGEVVAIVGPTGAGKSSIVNLIMRFYDPQQGIVRIEGTDLRRMRFSDFRRMIGVIPQDPFLFFTTVLDNIRYGDQSASDEEVYRIAREVGVDEFVRRLPNGYQTVISEGATNLSMGQKQLICFARAFLSDPKILIMDEATSGVDPVTELQLQRALTKMLEGRTAIIIAHRLSTIRLADRIVVLQGGQVVESGTFNELMAKRGSPFEKMYSLQFSTPTVKH